MAPMTPRARWMLIVGLAGAVLVAAVALILANRGGARAGAVDRAAGGSSASAAPADPASPVASGASPSLAEPAHAAPTREQDPPSVDTVSDNGATVHDHRADPGEIHDHPVLPTHGGAVFVGQAFAGSVGAAVTPIARACSAQIPADARGDKAVIQVQMIVTIKDGKMSIDDVDTSFRDVTGDQSAVKDCVRSKASSISIDAAGQPDVDHYAITMPMRVAS